MFLKDITHRDGKGSSKKFWYSIACLTATSCLGWITYKDTFEDWAYICLFSTYLITVGGFEIILKMMDMVIKFKNGGNNASDPNTPTTSPTTSGN